MERVSFLSGASGEWRIERIVTVAGEALPPAEYLQRIEGEAFHSSEHGWVLHGVRSHDRYARSDEKARMGAVQEGLGRTASTRAALIPIRKSPRWWALAQDERRAIFEERSHHIVLGERYLPAIARRLYHCRDLGGPFDFLTWFEFAPSDERAFDELVEGLRRTEEWSFVEREVEVRLRRLG